MGRSRLMIADFHTAALSRVAGLHRKTLAALAPAPMAVLALFCPHPAAPFAAAFMVLGALFSAAMVAMTENRLLGFGVNDLAQSLIEAAEAQGKVA